MICKPDSILDDIWSKVKAVCIDYDLPGRAADIKGYAPEQDEYWFLLSVLTNASVQNSPAHVTMRIKPAFLAL